MCLVCHTSVLLFRSYILRQLWGCCCCDLWTKAVFNILARLVLTRLPHLVNTSGKDCLLLRSPLSTFPDDFLEIPSTTHNAGNQEDLFARPEAISRTQTSSRDSRPDLEVCRCQGRGCGSPRSYAPGRTAREQLPLCEFDGDTVYLGYNDISFHGDSIVTTKLSLSLDLH